MAGTYSVCSFVRASKLNADIAASDHSIAVYHQPELVPSARESVRTALSECIRPIRPTQTKNKKGEPPTGTRTRRNSNNSVIMFPFAKMRDKVMLTVLHFDTENEHARAAWLVAGGVV